MIEVKLRMFYAMTCIITCFSEKKACFTGACRDSAKSIKLIKQGELKA